MCGLEVCLHVNCFMQMYMQEICGFYMMVILGFLTSDVDAKTFARDLEKVFSSIKAIDIVAYIFALVPTMQPQELDTEIVVATTTGTATNATAVAANVVVDERQMNALFLGVVSYFRLNLLEPKDNLFGLANHRICSSPETALVL
ncbi:putative aarF domain-containing protein kinase, chloroplastic [Glycine max]|nr:putative aarF domain-containing protein kinase, chloroplastic [Glycine max]